MLVQSPQVSVRSETAAVRSVQQRRRTGRRLLQAEFLVVRGQIVERHAAARLSLAAPGKNVLGADAAARADFGGRGSGPRREAGPGASVTPAEAPAASRVVSSAWSGVRATPLHCAIQSRISRSSRSAGAGKSTVWSPNRADTGWVPFDQRVQRPASPVRECCIAFARHLRCSHCCHSAPPSSGRTWIMNAASATHNVNATPLPQCRVPPSGSSPAACMEAAATVVQASPAETQWRLSLSAMTMRRSRLSAVGTWLTGTKGGGAPPAVTALTALRVTRRNRRRGGLPWPEAGFRPQRAGSARRKVRGIGGLTEVHIRERRRLRRVKPLRGSFAALRALRVTRRNRRRGGLPWPGSGLPATEGR